MKIDFYYFKKKKNSTKLPDSKPVISTEGYFKSPQGKGSLAIDCTGVPQNCNYCYISVVNRYYFIDDVEYINDSIIRFYLIEDVLASFKEAIETTTAYVLRSSSEFDTSIIDTFYPATVGSQQLTAEAQFIPLANPGFIVSVIGTREDAISNTTGATRYYLLTDTALANLMKWIFNENNYQTEITDQVVKTFFNPSQYIVSCMYCPFASGGTGETIQLAWWDTGISAMELSPNSPIEIDTVSVDVPKQYSGNDYRNFEPFTNYRMYIPFIGMIDLSSELLRGVTKININGCVDIATGTLMLKVSGNNGKIIGYYEGKGCVDLPLAQSSMPVNLVTGLSSLLAIAGDQSGLSSIPFGEELTSIASSITNTQRQLSKTSNAGNAGQRNFDSNVRIFTDYKTIVDRDISDFGLPLCKVKTIGNLNGFIKCKDAHFSNSYGTLKEINQIEDYMNGGFYLE